MHIVNKDRDTCLYQSLIGQVGIYKKKFPIYYKTMLRPLKKVDFQTTDLNKWTVIKKTNMDFKSFVSHIDLNQVKEKELTDQIDLHPFTTRTFESLNSRYQPFLALSPIIYSADKTMAVCGIFDWAEPENSSETVFLLELKEGKWQIVKFLPVSMS